MCFSYALVCLKSCLYVTVPSCTNRGRDASRGHFKPSEIRRISGEGRRACAVSYAKSENSAISEDPSPNNSSATNASKKNIFASRCREKYRDLNFNVNFDLVFSISRKSSSKIDIFVHVTAALSFIGCTHARLTNEREGTPGENIA